MHRQESNTGSALMKSSLSIRRSLREVELFGKKLRSRALCEQGSQDISPHLLCSALSCHSLLISQNLRTSLQRLNEPVLQTDHRLSSAKLWIRISNGQSLDFYAWRGDLGLKGSFWITVPGKSSVHRMSKLWTFTSKSESEPDFELNFELKT